MKRLERGRGSKTMINQDISLNEIREEDENVQQSKSLRDLFSSCTNRDNISTRTKKACEDDAEDSKKS